MKTTLIALTLFAVLNPAARANEASDAAFARLKNLAGTWSIKEDGKEKGEISYEVASEGTSIIERLEGMVTVYHQDGDTLLATHFCSMGNQPRMRASDLVAPYATVDFKFVDVTNLMPGDTHIAGVKFQWIDETHVDQTWTDRDEKGKDSSFTFKLERKAAPGVHG